MKRKIVFGLLVAVLLLFFVTSSWALDYKRYKYNGDPWQECKKVPVTPQVIETYPTIIKSIFVPAGQNLPILIFIDKSLNEVPTKTKGSTKSSTNSFIKSDRIK